MGKRIKVELDLLVTDLAQEVLIACTNRVSELPGVQSVFDARAIEQTGLNAPFHTIERTGSNADDEMRAEVRHRELSMVAKVMDCVYGTGFQEWWEKNGERIGHSEGLHNMVIDCSAGAVVNMMVTGLPEERASEVAYAVSWMIRGTPEERGKGLSIRDTCREIAKREREKREVKDGVREHEQHLALLSQVAEIMMLRDERIESVFVEYPGQLAVDLVDGDLGFVWGTVNGVWEADVYKGDSREKTSAHVSTTLNGHEKDPMVIAQRILGAMEGAGWL